MARKNRNLTQTRHGSFYKSRLVIAEICQHCGGLCKIWEIAEKDGKGTNIGNLLMRESLKKVSKCFAMGRQVSKGVMCLHIQVRKLSLLGISVAGVYCCMGLRSVSIVPRSSLLLRSDPSIVNFN